jgi:Arc/MetJ-type ribon-helix-helix transcriptional regulator
MRHLTIRLPDELAHALAREAQRRRVSVSEVVRDALRQHLGIDQREPRTMGFVGIGRSGHRDTARNVEEILAREWSAARDH